MVISDDSYFPILVDNIEVPMKTDMFWTLSLEHRDFMLTPLYMFEELTTPVMVMNILGYAVEVPTNWHILIFSEETSQLDIVEISKVSRGYFTAMVFNHKTNRVIPGPVSVIGYEPAYKIQTVSLHKNSMLCHALGEDHWICLSPSDNYNKYLKNSVIGDLTG